MKSKKSKIVVSLITAIACILALAAGVLGYSDGNEELNEKKERSEKLEAKLEELDGKLETVDGQKADYEALKAYYDDALEEYNEEVEEQQTIMQDYEGSVIGYNQGLVGGAGIDQLTLALTLSGNVDMTWDRNELAKSRSAYERGLREYEAAKSTYDEANKQFKNGKYAYNQGKAQLEEAKKQIEEGQEQYETALKAYNTSYAAYQRIVEGLRTVEQHGLLHQIALYTLGIQLGEPITDRLVADTTAQFNNAKAQLEAASTQLEQAKATVSSGESQIAAAKPQLDKSEKQLKEYKNKLDAGLAELNAAKEMLDAKAAEDEANKAELPEAAQPEDSAMRKAQIELANLEHISEIDESLLDTPEGLNQAEAIVKNNETLLTNYKASLESAKKELDDYEAIDSSLQRGCEQLINDGYAEKEMSSAETVEAAHKAADKLSSYCARKDIANTASVVLMAASAVFGLLMILAMTKKPEKLLFISLAAFGTALLGMITGGYSLLGILAVAFILAAIVTLEISNRVFQKGKH